MKDDDKAYICDNPYLVEYHFGYALYIRNHYIHRKDFSEAGFRINADDLSSSIMEYIFSMLLPDEYYYQDSFTAQLFENKAFIKIRKGYKELYGQFPVQIIEKYRTHSPKSESRFDKMDRDEWFEMTEEELDTEIELYNKEREQRSEVINELIKDLTENVWRVEDIKNIARNCGINPDSLEDDIQEIKNIFFEEKEYIPMLVVLLPYRESIGEEQYIEYRTLLCKALDEHPRLLEKLDKVYFKDRKIAKAVLKHGFGLEFLPEYQDDDEMVRYALEHEGCAIQFANERFLKDREWVRFAIEHSDNDIMKLDCMKPFRSDKEFVYLACGKAKWNFRHVDEVFRDDEGLAHIVINDNDKMMSVFDCLSDRLKDDLSLALIDASGEYPYVEYYSERLRDNDEVAERLIEVHGIDYWQFREMSDRIQKKYGYGEKNEK